jgi:hypothetical protein
MGNCGFIPSAENGVHVISNAGLKVTCATNSIADMWCLIHVHGLESLALAHSSGILRESFVKRYYETFALWKFFQVSDLSCVAFAMVYYRYRLKWCDRLTVQILSAVSSCIISWVIFLRCLSLNRYRNLERMCPAFFNVTLYFKGTKMLFCALNECAVVFHWSTVHDFVCLLWYVLNLDSWNCWLVKMFGTLVFHLLRNKLQWNTYRLVMCSLYFLYILRQQCLFTAS